MDVIADIFLSPRASGSRFRRRCSAEQSLEQLVLSLEEAAFRLLEFENGAYLAGEFEAVATFAQWRSNIRLAADALCAGTNDDE